MLCQNALNQELQRVRELLDERTYEKVPYSIWLFINISSNFIFTAYLNVILLSENDRIAARANKERTYFGRRKGTNELISYICRLIF